MAENQDNNISSNPLPNIDPHDHNGINSDKILYSNIYNAIDLDTVVLLTTAQTIAGIKTFTSIPVLPDSNPTTDNQAARKKYVDDTAGELEVIASDSLIDSANTTQQTSSTTYIKVKEIEFNEVDGVIRIKFDLRLVGASDDAFGRIYINGIAVGTERITGSSTFTTYSEDLSVSTGDLIQLFIHREAGGSNAEIRNNRLYYDKVFIVTPGTVNLN